MKRISCFFLPVILVAVLGCAVANVHAPLVTQDIQNKMTPDDALHRLIVGNERFINKNRLNVNYIKKAQLTAKGQYPIAIVLGCIDSRVPPEIVFDQNIGNIFIARTAGNVINQDVLAGMEYATAVVHAKLIVVMGHESCGAVKAACEDVKLGYLTQLFAKIHPAIDKATRAAGKKECQSPAFINQISQDNVRHVVALIPEMSPIIHKLVQEKKVKIVGAMYHLETGEVTFIN